MPIYTYRCNRCGKAEDARRAVAERDSGGPPCPCGGARCREFTPTTQIAVPARFQLARGWHLPDTREGWAGMGSPDDRSRIHAPDDGMRGYRQELERTLQGL